MPGNTIYEAPETLSIELYDYLAKRHYPKIIEKVKAFNPCVLYIFNYSEWPELAAALKSQFPKIPIFLDLQTPLLAQGDKREDIRSRGERAQCYITKVFTYSKSNIETWIKNPAVLYHEYPLGVDCASVPPYRRKALKNHQGPYHAIYFGSLNPLREIDKFVFLLQKSLGALEKQVTLDLYGDKVSDQYREKILLHEDSWLRLNLRPAISQKELFQKFSDYDFGIAWVPNTQYTDSPSLKLIEMMASGMPVIASNTNAHRLCIEGCEQIPLFDETEFSLTEALSKLLTHLASHNPTININASKRYSFTKIFADHLLPIMAAELATLGGKRGTESSNLLQATPLDESLTNLSFDKSNCPDFITYALISSFYINGQQPLTEYLRKICEYRSQSECIQLQKYVVTNHPKQLVGILNKKDICLTRPIVLAKTLDKIKQTNLKELFDFLSCRFIIIDPELLLSQLRLDEVMSIFSDTAVLNVILGRHVVASIIDAKVLQNTKDCKKATIQDYCDDALKAKSIDFKVLHQLTQKNEKNCTKKLSQIYCRHKYQSYKTGLSLK
ncbi:glycosyltransferase [Allochromatium vinosum]|nr:glycosyltransferase [Allochromatium vinosum]